MIDSNITDEKIQCFNDYFNIKLNFSDEYRILIEAFHNTYKNNSNSDIDSVEIIILKLFNCDSICNDSDRLFKLYNLAIVFGLYETACKIRLTITNKLISGPLSQKRILAKLENNLKLTKNESIFLNFNNPNLYLYYQKSLGKSIKLDCKDSDKSYHNLINGKRVLIIGPLFNYQIDISNFDVIIFIKNQDSQTLDFFKNLKCVFYYNSFNISNGSFESYFSENSSKGFFCLKDTFNKIENTENIRTFRKNVNLLTGGPMMLQNIIFDLSFFFSFKYSYFRL